MALTDGQVQFNGMILGDNINTFMSELTGWDDLPPVDSGNTPIPLYHGSYAGAKYARERVITWTGIYNPEDLSQWLAILRQIRAATTISSTEKLLTVRTIDEELQCYASVTARAIPNHRGFGAAKKADVSIQFTCSDPRRYSTDQTTLVIQFPDAGSSGLVYPLTYPLDYGIASIGGSGIFVNDGDAPLPCVYRINGPATTPTISLGSGKSLTFNITLAAGEYLDIDTVNITVVLNGTADRLYTRAYTSTPIKNMELEPGINNIGVSAGSWDTSLGSSVTVTAQSAAYF